MNQIAALIEEEVQQRVRATITPMLEYIARTYDVRLEQLMRDVSAIKPVFNGCQGFAKKGKRCDNHAKANGYCHLHQDQVPKPPEPIRDTHTHTLPPLFLAGCPVCERSRRIKDLEDCFDNE